MQEVSRSSITPELQLSALISDLWSRVDLLNSDISEEEARARASTSGSQPIRFSLLSFVPDAITSYRRSMLLRGVQTHRTIDDQ